MPGRSSKPVAVLEQEGRSHRTKAELEARRKAEAALLTGEHFKEQKKVKATPAAHHEFLRLRKLLTKIEKHDALFEGVVNRYCLITAEVEELVEERTFMAELIAEAKDRVEKDEEATAADITDMMRTVQSFYGKLMRLDATIAEKRKMLLSLEKEMCLTVAAQLRSIPKTEEKASSPLLDALKM